MEISTITHYLNQAGKIPLLTAEQEQSLLIKARKGCTDSRNQLISANLRLVIAVAKKYMGHGLDLPDLISEGNFGLIRAIDKFNPTTGHRLSTYAMNWIHEKIQRAVMNKGCIVRLPVHRHQELRKMGRAIKALRQVEDHFPSDKELCLYLGWPAKKVRKMLHLMNHYAVAVDMNDNDQSGLTILADDVNAGPAAQYQSDDNRATVQRLLDKLDAKEKQVIEYRFGLTDDKKTLLEVGQIVGLTHERIRQIQMKAMAKMQQAARM